jgi:bifunctional non-homologous end joining protein LigD
MTLLTSLRAARGSATDSPFVDPPTGAEGRRARWVKPELVGEVTFTEWTRDGTLRHPSFEGLREDKRARDVGRDTPAHQSPERDASAAAPREPARAVKPGARKHATKRSKTPDEPARPSAKPSARSAARRASASNADAIADVVISNGDKLLYPEAALTKRDLAEYYAAVGEWIVPQLSGRPMTLVRCPNGWDKPCFFQKHANQALS